jgi:hypothetical protein
VGSLPQLDTDKDQRVTAEQLAELLQDHFINGMCVHFHVLMCFLFERREKERERERERQKREKRSRNGA